MAGTTQNSRITAGTYVSVCGICGFVVALLVMSMVGLAVGGVIGCGGLVITLSALAAIASGATIIVVKLGQWQEATSQRLAMLEQAIVAQVPELKSALTEYRDTFLWAEGYVEGCGARKKLVDDPPTSGLDAVD
jgi:hypothetical protein